MLLVRCRRLTALPLVGGILGAFIFLSSARAALSVAGADVSALGTLEGWGAVYRADGKPTDALMFLRDQGANCFRLRLFVAPDGNLLVTNSLDYTLALAKRVKASGARFILDIHYSDTWADPAIQSKPAAWRGLPFEQLVVTVKDYTAQVLTRFKEQGVSPDFVQLGNEITNGMLWPEGKIDYPQSNSGESWSHLGELLRAARDGFDSVYREGSRPLVILHIESTGDAERSVWFYQQATNHHVAFDVAGFSYYPEWHGGVRQLHATLSQVAATFHKPVLVVETAYPWKNDEHWRGRPHLDWPLTVAGQQAFLRDVTRAVQNVPEGLGLGIIYWHPESIPAAEKPCWLGGSCALFSSNGEALPSVAFARAALTADPVPPDISHFSSVEPK